MAQRSLEKTVRFKHIDRVMQFHDQDVGQKVALSLKEYHLQFVEPTLQWIRLPWWQRVWRKYVRKDAPWQHAAYAVPEPEPEP